jgi:hypothetical protein
MIVYVPKALKQKYLFFILFMILSISVSAQDISGIWGGIFYTETANVQRQYFIFLEIKQKGRSLWGVYNTTDSNNNGTVNCLCSVSGLISRKPGALVDLYKERVEEYNTRKVSYGVCDNISHFNVHYFMQDSVAYLTGKWFYEMSKGRAQGADGVLVLQHLGRHVDRNVDQYFPNLAKMIEKGANDSTMSITADDISAATPVEKRLILSIQTIMGKRTH